MTGALGAGAFATGALELALTVGCALVASVLAVRARRPELTGATRACALGLLTVCGVLAAELIPLTLGILSRATVPLTALAVLVTTGAACRAAPVAPPPDRRPTRLRLWPSAGIAAVALLATATAWLAYLLANAGLHVQSADAMNFHLPGVVGFIHSRSLWHVTQYVAGQAQGYYPQNGDALLLALALPWHSLALVRYADVPLLTLAGLGVYATGRELNAPAASSALVALALIAIRPTLGPALPDVLVDPTFLAGFACGTLFLTRHARTGERADVVLAGLGLGVALGTKWYGLTDVPALVLAWAVVTWRRKRSTGPVVRDGAWLIAAIALTGGLWLVRNLVLTGNPVFDYRVSLFGLTVFPAPSDELRRQIGFSLAHYANSFGVLRRYVWPVFRADFGITGGVIVLGAVAATVRGWRDRRVPMLAASALLCALAYSVTPYSAQGLPGAPVLVSANTRYGAPALLLAAPLLALAIGRAGRLRWAIEALLLVAVGLDLHRYLPTPPGRVEEAAAVVLAAAAAWWLMRARGIDLRRRAHYGAVATAAAACVAAAGAYHFQRALADAPYEPSDPSIDYVLARAPAGTRIGMAGLWNVQGLVPVAPLFGPRLQNSVGYVGPFREHRLAQYTREDRFVAALRRRRYSLLEIGTGFPPSPVPIQERWAQAAGYVPVTHTSRLILLRAPGR